MPVTISTHAQEQSTFVVSISFYDDDGNSVVPSSVKWTLTDRLGHVVNNRQDVSIAPAATVDIVLSGMDLQVTQDLGRDRILTVEYVYSSSIGSGLLGKDWVYFTIDDNPAIV